LQLPVLLRRLAHFSRGRSPSNPIVAFGRLFGLQLEHNLVCSTSCRGNCHDNAVAESFYQLLKRERIRHQIYRTRDDD
jgi:transposase InsO family protein